VIESALTSTPLIHEIPRARGLMWPLSCAQILAANFCQSVLSVRIVLDEGS
jgi:hypothetical protein